MAAICWMSSGDVCRRIWLPERGYANNPSVSLQCNVQHLHALDQAEASSLLEPSPPSLFISAKNSDDPNPILWRASLLALGCAAVPKIRHSLKSLRGQASLLQNGVRVCTQSAAAFFATTTKGAFRRPLTNRWLVIAIYLSGSATAGYPGSSESHKPLSGTCAVLL